MRLTLSHAVLAALGVVATAATSSFASDAPPGNVNRGAEAFQKVCSACHTIEQGARRRVGPNLFGVLGSRIAQKEGYPYTEAFRRSDIVWNEATLSDFLASPGAVVPGTKMDWTVKDEQVIADLIAFIRDYR
jgi:cytochrome c